MWLLIRLLYSSFANDKISYKSSAPSPYIIKDEKYLFEFDWVKFPLVVVLSQLNHFSSIV